MEVGFSRCIAVVGMAVAGALAGAGPAAAAEGLIGESGVALTAQAPTSICGNAVAVAGDTTASCSGGSTSGGSSVDASVDSSVGASLGTSVTSGSGAESVTAKVAVPGTDGAVSVDAPITVCGNAVAVAGAAEASCDGNGTSAGTSTSTSTGTSSDGTGNKVVADVSTPVTICGNAFAVAGSAAAGCGATTSTSPPGGGSGGAGGAGAVGVGDGAVRGSGGGLAAVPGVVSPNSYRNAAPLVDATEKVSTGVAAGTTAAGSVRTRAQKSRPETAVLAGRTGKPAERGKLRALARTGAVLSLYVVLIGLCLMLLGAALTRAGIALPRGARTAQHLLGNSWTKRSN